MILSLTTKAQLGDNYEYGFHSYIYDGKEPLDTVFIENQIIVLNKEKDTLEITDFMDGKRHGTQHIFFPDRRTETIANYENGLLKGRVEHYRVNTYSSSEVHFLYATQNYVPVPEKGYSYLAGKEIIYFENDSIRSFTNYVKGRKNGAFKSFHNNGQLNTHFYYENDQVVGRKLIYSYSGNILHDENYIIYEIPDSLKNTPHNEKRYILEPRGINVLSNLSVLHGSAKYYDREGNLRADLNYKEGLKHGLCKEYYEFGDKLLRSEVVFKDGIENGSFAYYDPKGNLESKGDYQRVMPDGNVFYDGRIVFNKMYGGIMKPWRIETWKDFKRNGVFETYRYNYNKVTGSQCYGYTKFNYVDNLRSGIQETFDGEGIKTSERYFEIVEINGRAFSQNTGTHKEWRKGQLISLTEWKNGLKNGVSKQYYDNGQLAAESYYEDDRLIDISKTYYENGELGNITSVEINENKDRIYSVKSYFRNGQLKRDYTQIPHTRLNPSKYIGWYTAYEENGNLLTKFYSNNKGDLIVEYLYNNGQLEKIKIGNLLSIGFNFDEEIESMQWKNILLAFEIHSNQKLSELSFFTNENDLAIASYNEDGEMTSLRNNNNGSFKYKKTKDKQTKEKAKGIAAQYSPYWNGEEFSKFGTKDGIHKRNYADGSPYFKIEFKDFLPHGSWIMYNPLLNDTLIYANYDNGAPVEKWINKDLNAAKLSEINYYKNHKIENKTEYFLDGKTRYISNHDSLGKQVSEFYYYSSGQLKSTTNNKSNDYINFSENGDTIGYRKTSNINDSISIERIFHKNNRIKSNSIYNFDTESRNYTTFYKNGNIKSVANTKYPQKISEYKKYNKRGKLILEGKSKEGKRDGEWIEYGLFGTKKVTEY
ncbi:toxin-antitoxin system YwqK family antitoxin [Brumimicrobium oceani]|nr:hypothetical protein [Brumimicrobium oceani]